jgi:tetratricopeptide (TPR) repeat protein
MAQEQIREFIDQATQSIQSGQFEGAIQLLDQALAIAPANAEALVLKGICLSQSGQPSAATESFNKAVILEPSNSKAHYNMAVHLYALGQKTEALKHAREAAQNDATHAGARQLIATLEAEISPPAPAIPNPNDPLAGMGTALPVASAPQANPYQQSNPYAQSTPESPRPGGMGPAPIATPSHNPYMKQGYETPTHSLPLVENLGSAWLGIGWALAALSFAGFVVGVLVAISAMSGANLNDPDAIARAMEGQGAMLWVSRITGFGSLIGIMIWSIMDIIDRRGNFVWLIPNIICSCCGFGWVTLPIYILAGRNK